MLDLVVLFLGELFIPDMAAVAFHFTSRNENSIIFRNILNGREGNKYTNNTKQKKLKPRAFSSVFLKLLKLMKLGIKSPIPILTRYVFIWFT